MLQVVCMYVRISECTYVCMYARACIYMLRYMHNMKRSAVHRVFLPHIDLHINSVVRPSRKLSQGNAGGGKGEARS